MNGAYSNLFLYLDIAYSDYYANIEKQDLAKFHINAARQYITPQSYPLYLGTYYDACARYYLSRKNYHLALNYCDSALTNYKKGTSNEMQYAKQLTFKANILQEMNEYKKQYFCIDYPIIYKTPYQKQFQLFNPMKLKRRIIMIN